MSNSFLVKSLPFWYLPLVVGSLIILSDPASVSAEEKATRKATVYCVVSEQSTFPFAAGNDRCFKEINGKKSVYKSSAVCAVKTTDGPRLRFIYSVAPQANCIDGAPATRKEDYAWGLDMLGEEEKAFFLKHVDAK